VFWLGSADNVPIERDGVSLYPSDLALREYGVMHARSPKRHL
jgi:hypothetical protein